MSLPFSGRDLTDQVLEHGDMPGLSKETVVDIWLNSDDAIRVLEKGYKIIHAAVEYFYLVSTSHHVVHRQRSKLTRRTVDTVIG
jgi:N-acetyl-beta-hexosaminidase